MSIFVVLNEWTNDEKRNIIEIGDVDKNRREVIPWQIRQGHVPSVALTR